MVEASTASWEFWYGLLEVFKNREEHCKVTKSFKSEDGYRLGIWVGNQRRKKNKLTEKQINKLNNLNFIWDVYSATWQAGLTQLEMFVEQHGHCNIPSDYISKSGYKLGSWVSSRRKSKDTLTSEQIDQLNTLKFIWSVSSHNWEIGFLHLQKFEKQNGNCDVQINYTSESGFKLGIWVSTQRQNNDLSANQIDRLNELNFSWSIFSNRWQESVDQLKEFKKQHGHCNIPTDYISKSGQRLGWWVSTQRQKKKQLSEPEISQLDELEFIWDMDEFRWDEGFKQLSEFKKIHGHCRVSGRYITSEGFKLGNWVSNQRQKKNTLQIKRVNSLNAIGFMWNPIKKNT